VREDAVDNARVGYEANDPQSGRAGRAGKRLDLEHAAQELGPGEPPGASGGRVVARVDGRCAVGS